MTRTQSIWHVYQAHPGPARHRMQNPHNAAETLLPVVALPDGRFGILLESYVASCATDAIQQYRTEYEEENGEPCHLNLLAVPTKPGNEETRQ